LLKIARSADRRLGRLYASTLVLKLDTALGKVEVAELAQKLGVEQIGDRLVVGARVLLEQVSGLLKAAV
jgi:hypothetical protein